MELTFDLRNDFKEMCLSTDQYKPELAMSVSTPQQSQLLQERIFEPSQPTGPVNKNTRYKLIWLIRKSGQLEALAVPLGSN